MQGTLAVGVSSHTADLFVVILSTGSATVFSTPPTKGHTMDYPTILNDMDFYEDDATPEATALTEAMAGTAMTLSEMDEWFGQDF